MNYEHDRAKRIEENEPPSFEEEPKQEAVLSKKKTDQYLLWSDIDPDPVESKQAVEEEKFVDPNQQELDFDKEPEVEVPGNDLENWNNWVEAANKAAEENPEDEDIDDEYFQNASPEEKSAMQQWKADTGGSLKIQRSLLLKGAIQKLPWIDYLKAKPDFVEESKFQIMPELENQLKGKPQYTEVVDPKKKNLLNWMEKEGKEQIKKTKEVDEE
jgi:hypothetical protein